MSTEDKQQRLAEYYYWSGASYLQAGEKEKAREAFDKFEDLDCGSYELYAGLGYNYREIGDTAEDKEEKDAAYLKAAEAFAKATEKIEE